MEWKRLPSKRCGAHDSTRDMENETSDRLAITQEPYAGKRHSSKNAREIDISMYSMGKGTRTSYRPSWRRWLSFFRWQELHFWLSSPEECRDGSLMNFILSER